MDSLPVTSPTLRYTAWLMLSLFLLIVVGSYFAETEIVARGTGRVMATGHTQTIQPQFEGKVSEIKVMDGVQVKAGELLVRLDGTQINAEIERLSATLNRAKRHLAINEAVLTALVRVDPAATEFQEIGLNAFSGMALPSETRAEDESYLKDSMASVTANAMVFDAQIDQAESTVQTARARIRKADTDKALLIERNKPSGKLSQIGIISKTAYLDDQRAIASAEGEVAVANQQLKESEAQKQTARKSREQYVATIRSDHQQNSANLRGTIAIIEADLAATKNKLSDTAIVSPVSGRVEHMQVFTLGGFVTGGQTLMSVVPDGDGLEIEALFENRDAGFLATGQDVFIKLDAYPAERFGILKGKVMSVGADARKDDTTKAWVYAAKIKPATGFVEHDGKHYPIVPGMTGTMDVVTGDRRLISYFFEPIIKAIQDGFGER